MGKRLDIIVTENPRRINNGSSCRECCSRQSYSERKRYQLGGGASSATPKDELLAGAGTPRISAIWSSRALGVLKRRHASRRGWGPRHLQREALRSSVGAVDLRG